MSSRFMYQTIQLPGRYNGAFGPSARGDAVGAGVKLLHKASIALNRWSVSYRVNKELEALALEIEKEMSSYEEQHPSAAVETGVLVVVGIQEWAIPDPTGTRAQMFLSIHVGGAGCDPVAVMKDYVSTPRLVPGAAKGWRRCDEYIWVTRGPR